MFNFFEWKRCDDIVGYHDDGRVFDVWRSNDSFVLNGWCDPIYVMVDDNFIEVDRKTPSNYWSVGFSIVNRKELEQFAMILELANKRR